jgi:fatty acid desaturase
VFWVASWYLLALDATAVAICYAAFAFSWSSQQYIYHVRTPRHLFLGAYDLKLWKPMEWLYLKFNYHLAHHQAVSVPWIYMDSVAKALPERGYWDTYCQLWAPPQPVSEAWPQELQRRGPIPPRNAHDAALGAVVASADQ